MHKDNFMTILTQVINKFGSTEVNDEKERSNKKNTRTTIKFRVVQIQIEYAHFNQQCFEFNK